MSATRLKNKPLLEINNLPIVCHVVKRAKETGIGNVIVATEDKEIVTAVENNDGEAILTGNHKTGTDRVFEAFKKLKIANIDYVVNLQGDEPMIDPKDVVKLNNLMIKTNSDIGTLASEIKESSVLTNENIVKVITKKKLENNNFVEAVDFSRQNLPNQNLKYHIDEVKEGIEKIEGDLVVKYFPTKSASVNTISAHLQKMRMKRQYNVIFR